MNLPQIIPFEEIAIDSVTNAINKAKFAIGHRQNLHQLAGSRNEIATQSMLSLQGLGRPISKHAESFLADAIETKWKLTPVLMYILKYHGISQDECSQYYYYEAIFSQPSNEYPIPQATGSVFFRIHDTHVEPAEIAGVPKMTFRVEGSHVDHDVRFVLLTIDWILAIIQTKLNFFKRIEDLNVF